MTELAVLGTAAAHLPAVQSAAGKAAGTLAAAAGRSVARKVRGSAETKALAQPLAEALIRCVEHARHDNIDATDQWWSDVAALPRTFLATERPAAAASVP